MVIDVLRGFHYWLDEFRPPRQLGKVRGNHLGSIGTRAKFVAGFTLIELLVVMAIVAILTIPAILSFRLIQERNLDSVTDAISTKFRFAQVYAQANGTYTWVGVQNNPGGGIVLAIWASKDGTSTIATTNLSPISSTILCHNVGLSAYTDPDATVINISNSDLAASAPGVFSTQLSGNPISFTQVVQFAPSGACMIHLTQTVSWIELPLVKMAGATLLPTTTPSLIRISGLTGRVTIVSN